MRTFTAEPAKIASGNVSNLLMDGFFIASFIDRDPAHPNVPTAALVAELLRRCEAEPKCPKCGRPLLWCLPSQAEPETVIDTPNRVPPKPARKRKQSQQP